MLHFIHEGIRCNEDHAIEIARARFEEKKLHEHRTRAGRTVQSPIVLFDEGDEDEDDTTRLSDLITLAKAGLQTEDAEDDTSRLSELMALAEAGLQAEEDDDTFFTQAIEAVDEADAAYYKRQTDQDNTGEPSHMSQTEEDAFLTQAAEAVGEAEATYYRRQADQGNAGEPSHNNEVVVEDWYSNKMLLTQYVSD